MAPGVVEPGGGSSLPSPSPSPSPILARAAGRERPVRRGGGGGPQLVLAVGEQAATRIGTAAAESGGRGKQGKAAAAMRARKSSIGGRARCARV